MIYTFGKTIVTRILRIPKTIQTIVGYKNKITSLVIVFLAYNLRTSAKNTRELEENEREVAIQMYATMARKKIE